MTTPGEVKDSKIPFCKRSLIHAADSGDIECVKRLIGEKHNVNEKYKGLSKAFNSLSVPLHYACRSGHLEVVKLLIENGADIDAVDIENWTSLHYCCNNGHDDIVAYLMAQGIDQTAKDVVYKNSALQFAKHRQFYKIIKLLSPKESFGTYKRLSLAVPKPVDKPIYSPGSTLFLLRYSFKNRASDEEKLTTWRKNPFSKSIILTADDKELDGLPVLLIFDHEFENHKRNSTNFDGVIRTSAISTHEFIVVVKATV